MFFKNKKNINQDEIVDSQIDTNRQKGFNYYYDRNKMRQKFKEYNLNQKMSRKPLMYLFLSLVVIIIVMFLYFKLLGNNNYLFVKSDIAYTDIKLTNLKKSKLLKIEIIPVSNQINLPKGNLLSIYINYINKTNYLYKRKIFFQDNIIITKKITYTKIFEIKTKIISNIFIQSDYLKYNKNIIIK